MTVAMHFFINILDADAERGGIPSRENTNLEKNPGIYPIIIFDKWVTQRILWRQLQWIFITILDAERRGDSIERKHKFREKSRDLPHHNLS